MSSLQFDAPSVVILVSWFFLSQSTTSMTSLLSKIWQKTSITNRLTQPRRKSRCLRNRIGANKSYRNKKMSPKFLQSPQTWVIQITALSQLLYTCSQLQCPGVTHTEHRTETSNRAAYAEYLRNDCLGAKPGTTCFTKLRAWLRPVNSRSKRLIFRTPLWPVYTWYLIWSISQFIKNALAWTFAYNEACKPVCRDT